MYNQPWKLVQNKIRGAGGREIDKFRGVTPPIDNETGSEAWIGSVTRVEKPPVGKPNYGCSEVILPDGKQCFLFEAIEAAPGEILGQTHMKKNGTGLGMLIKYLDAQRQYGLQCHPTPPLGEENVEQRLRQRRELVCNWYTRRYRGARIYFTGL